VQLPIYNEMYVVERLIEAACRLDYPRDRLQIQVLDDSSDGTTQRAGRAIARWRRRGLDVTHIRRGHRRGYKAGALAHGLDTARGEFIAIFDADFVPGSSFLLELIPYFNRPRIGMVQARWGHLNRDYSLLTRLQSILLDGHFAIEHAARNRSGRFFNFNGTAGIWRKSCIESAGGWRADTLTEDLDLSYRAQLAGWRFVFASHVVAPAELPADIGAFKTQQHRWTRGSIETGLKLLPRLLRAPLPLSVRTEALFHLTNNSAYLLMVLLALLMIPAMSIRRAYALDHMLLLEVPLFLMSTVSISAFYLCSQRETRTDWRRSIALMPILMSLGIGLSLNNARAVLDALRGHPCAFVRTPKYDLRGRSGTCRGKRYGGVRRRTLVATEWAFAIAFSGAAVSALGAGHYAALPFLLLFQGGFLYVALLSLVARSGGSSLRPAIRCDNHHKQNRRAAAPPPVTIRSS
jgi:cellulose synthase/poly-beta-1,6-N-acetylglucosamine synthase-like glycosyltransferase